MRTEQPSNIKTTVVDMTQRYYSVVKDILPALLWTILCRLKVVLRLKTFVLYKLQYGLPPKLRRRFLLDEFIS